MTSAFYPGSFDPITYGHTDILLRCASLFKRLVLGIGLHHDKKSLFSPEERVALLRIVCDQLALTKNISIDIVCYDDLTTTAARRFDTSVIVRGIRNTADYAYEHQIAHMNKHLDPTLETVFFLSSPDVSMISSSLVRQIAEMGGDIRAFVPPEVAVPLMNKRRLPQ